MNLRDIYEMIKIIEKNNLGQLKHSNKKIEERLNLIGNFMRNLGDHYCEELKILVETDVRFCDYYDFGMFHGKEIIKYFEANYQGKDKSDLIDVFVLYVIIKNVQDIVYNYDICNDLNELYSLLDFNYYFEDIIEMISFINERNLKKTNDEEFKLEFLSSNNKYKIFFTGYTLNDLNNLNKNAWKGFIRKYLVIYQQLIISL